MGENLQKTGSFKFRGASSAISHYNELSKSGQKIPNCFVTHSSGNHGQALARACTEYDQQSFIVMPDISPQCKINAVKSYQNQNESLKSQTIFCEASDKARQGTCKKFATKKTVKSFIQAKIH